MKEEEQEQEQEERRTINKRRRFRMKSKLSIMGSMLICARGNRLLVIWISF